jgi:spore maturation protein A
MILVGVVYGGLTGNIEHVGNGAIESAEEAVKLCITMLGIMSMWMGFMEVAEKSGLIAKAERMLEPVINWLFPNLPKEHKARPHIITNIIANILGLGWAATPAGLKAMEELAADPIPQKGIRIPSHIATNEMCTFLVINISSLQLIPVNIIAYRSQYNSINPAAIVAPAILATTLSTLAGVIFCKVMCRCTFNKNT